MMVKELVIGNMIERRKQVNDKEEEEEVLRTLRTLRN
jgi:hypothetical protein